MPSTVGSLVLTILGTVPALVILVVIFHNPACDFKGSSLLLALAVFCACGSILVGRFLLQPPASREVEAQTDDLESGNGTMAETNTADPPPVYEAVVAKPPPYEDLYITLSDTSSVGPGSDSGPQDSEGPSAATSATTEESQEDPDLPSYSDIVKTASLDESESDIVARVDVNSSPE